MHKDRLMLKQVPSARKLARLNRRQRKKLRVGKFQELVFEVRIRFHQPMEEARLDTFLDGVIELIEARQLVVGGLGGTLPLLATDGIVSALKRGSPTEEDRQAVLDWARRRPEVADAAVGELVDGWYGWDDAP
jgi:uncharacterized protein YggL (DUF469 family)